LKKPLIGLTLDHEVAKTYSKYPWYAIRENYFFAIEKAGGVCIALPHSQDKINYYSELIDGLVITGGNFDIDPKIFGAKFRHNTVNIKKNRTDFELQLTNKILKLNKPVLGICGGEQLINVLYKGTLIQHIPDEIIKPLEHEQTNPRHEPGHEVTINKNSFLYNIILKDRIKVNSAHHQAVKILGKGLQINATSPDGVVEGIEDPTKKFCLGIQWHPEFFIQEYDLLIFKKFINSC